MTVIILQGIPGSGKSTYAKSLRCALPGTTFVSSMDDYRLDMHGNYDFLGADPKEVRCRAISDFTLAYYTHDNVIVDNTNCRFQSYLPYLAIVATMKPSQYTRIISVEYGLFDDDEFDTCIERGVHDVPRDIMLSMRDNLKATILDRYSPKHLGLYIAYVDKNRFLKNITGV